MAVGAFVHSQMEFMAEPDIPAFGLEGYIGRFEPLVTTVAVPGNGKCVLVVMAAAAPFTLFHVGHGEQFCLGLVGEDLGMAILAGIRAQMEFMAELSIRCPFYLEGDLLRGHPLVAVSTVPGNGEGALAVVASAAGLACFHLGHGDLLVPAGDNLAIVAAPALAAGFCDVELMAEERIRGPFLSERYASRPSLVATDAILILGDAESLDARMAGAAGSGLFHVSHGEMFGLFYIEYGVVTNPAVVVIFFQMDIMAENHRFGIFEPEQDVFGFFCK